MGSSLEIKLNLLFNKGHFEDVFIGKNDCFIKDYTSGEHDTITMFYHLFNWLRDGNVNEQNLIKIKNALTKIISSDLGVNKYDGGLISLGLIISYCIKAKSHNYWPLEKSFISNLLPLIPCETNSDKYNVKRDILRIREYLGVYPI
ncbi:MAG: hypothetical protein KDD24_07495 [Flavobacteriales bacterium]|nr:hypothetical protein [Flavobacteriales bacterium]MCB9174034.1 hypothetical protein [Flavobacteriales bacterium]